MRARILAALERPPPDVGRPSQVRLEAMSACNLRCPSCPTTKLETKPVIGHGALRPADFRRLVDANPWVEAIELSNYGEVFLNPELPEILRHAHERGVAIRMGNGVNLNSVREEALDAVVRYRVRFLTCSIDGATQETYAEYRRRGELDRVLGNVREIVERKRRCGSPYPHLVWQFVVFGHNEHELPRAREMAESLGMEFRPKLSWDEELSPVRDPERVEREIAAPAATRSEHKARTGRDPMRSICHQLWRNPQINWDGKLLGCCRNHWGEFGGNAFEDGLETVLRGARIEGARRALLGRGPMPPESPCTTCDLYHTLRETEDWLTHEEVEPPPSWRTRARRGLARLVGGPPRSQ